MDFVSIPAGTYLCEIAEVRVGTTKAGDPRWAIRLVVAEGEFTGRHAAWDGLVFSTRGQARVRRVFGELGLPNEGRVEIEPADLQGRRALVEVGPTEFVTPAGETIRRNDVPYDGYRAVPEEQPRDDPPRDDQRRDDPRGDDPPSGGRDGPDPGGTEDEIPF